MNQDTTLDEYSIDYKEAQNQSFEMKKRRLFTQIVGGAFNSFNYYHANMDELVYEAGLVIELEQKGLLVHRQEEFPIYYKGLPTPVKRRMDIVVSDRELGHVILELKAIDYVSDTNRKQLWSYMKLMHCRFGMLINFSPKGVYSENWEMSLETGDITRVMQ